MKTISGTTETSQQNSSPDQTIEIMIFCFSENLPQEKTFTFIAVLPVSREEV